jgi:PTH1 family peptidyl-tRNA hydrolase
VYLIVGLGNPGVRYKLTRHNIGFLVIDALAEHIQAKLNLDDFNALTCKVKVAGHDVVLAEPQTFMNLSGQSVQPLMTYFKIPPENLLVIHDEVDLPFARIRMQKNRSHGGHNGVRDIHDKIGSDYARLRLGVGRPTHPQMQVADFVLQNFSIQEQSQLADYIGNACDAVLDFIEDGFEKAQNKHNQG